MGLWGLSKLEVNLDAAVRSSAKVATQFKAIPLHPGESPVVLGTRFGGMPYAEAGDVWPRLGDRPYDFVAQLNLSQCEEPPTNAYELITVFVCWHCLENAEETERACVVRSYRNPSEAKAILMVRPAPTSDDDLQVVPCTAESRRVLTYPSPVGSYLRTAAITPLVGQHQNFGMAYEKSLKRIGYRWRDNCTQIGGYPTWVHDNTLDDADLFFVAQIAHEPAANFCIGDAAPIFIAAHRTDPTRFETDPWQTH